MSIQLVNIGSAANDGTGDPLRNAYIKLNANDAELYSLLDREIKTIVKNSHGFVSGNVLYLDNSGIFQKITSPNTQIPIGIVQTVIDANTFQLVEGGYVTSLSGLTAGTVYYVQATGVLGTTATALKYFMSDSASSGYILSGAGSAVAIGNFVLGGTSNSVLFIDNIGLLGQDNNNFYYNSTTHLLSVFTNGDFTGVDAINVYNEVDAYKPNSTQGAIGSGSESGFTFSTSRGTGTVPTVINSGDLLGGVSGWGYTGASAAYTSLAGMWASAQGVSSTLGGQLDFRTRADGGALTSRMTIDNAGTISVSSLNAGGLVKSITGALSIATPGTDYTVGGTAWLLPSGGTLTGPNTITGTTSNTLQFSFDNLGTGITAGAGLYLKNGTPAISGSQQTTPSIWFESQGFATTPNSSKTTQFIVYALPIQGATLPKSNLKITSGIDGSYSDVLSINSQGSIVFNQAGQSEGWFPAITSTPGNHTSLTASTEFLSRDYQGISWTWNTGALTTQRFNYFKGYTVNFNSASTLTSAYNVYIDQTVVGTNAAITNNYGLGVVGSIALVRPGTSNVSGQVVANGANFLVSSVGGGFLQLGVSGTTFGINTSNGNWSFGTATTDQARLYILQPALSSSWLPAFRSDPGAHTGMTASTEFISRDFQGSTQQWATGSLTTQRWNYFRGYTAAFVGASTLADAYTIYAESPTAGTNATITRSWAAGFGGNVLASSYLMPGSGLGSTPNLGLTTTSGSSLNIGAVSNGGGNGWKINFQDAGGSVTHAVFSPSSGLASLASYAFGTTTITNAQFYILQGSLSTSYKPAFRSDPGAHTGMTASTEFISRDFQGATQTWLDGTTTTQRFNYFRGYTVNKTTTSAIFNNVYTVYIDPSTAGTGVTINNNFALGLNGDLGLISAPSNDNALTQVLVRDGTTGTVKYRDSSSITGSGWSASGATTIIGNTSQSGNFTETMQFNNVLIGQNSRSGTNLSGAFTIAVGAHTTQTFTSNYTTLGVNESAQTIQFNTGGIGTIGTSLLAGGNTYSFVGASTITNAPTVWISGISNAGTNATITNAHGLLISSSSISGTVNNSYGLTVNANSGASSNYSAQFLGGIGVKFSQTAQSISHNFIDITQSAHTGGTPTGISFLGGSHTGLTAGTEFFDVRINLGNSAQFSTGNIAVQRSFYINPRSYSFVGASTITDAATFSASAPSGGTNATVTNSHAILVPSTAITGTTNGYGITVNAPTGATNNFSAQFIGGLGVKLSHLIGNTSAPSIAAGTGAGTSPTVTIPSGTDLSGIISILTGTGSPAATSIIATITFNVAYASAPKVVIYPANRAARDLAIGAWPIVPANGQTNGVTTTTFVLESGTALATSTTYLWSYEVIQ